MKNIRKKLNRNSNSVETSNLYSKEFCMFLRKHSVMIDTIVKYERNYELKYFGIQTLKKLYLLKDDGEMIKRTQDLFMGTATLEIQRDSLDKAFETYELLSMKFFIHAQPTLMNSWVVKIFFLHVFIESKRQ